MPILHRDVCRFSRPISAHESQAQYMSKKEKANWTCPDANCTKDIKKRSIEHLLDHHDMQHKGAVYKCRFEGNIRRFVGPNNLDMHEKEHVFGKDECRLCQVKVMDHDAAKQKLRVVLDKIVQMDAKVRIERTNKAVLYDESFVKAATTKNPPSGSLNVIVGVDPGLKTFATAAALNWKDFVHHVRNIPRFATHFNDAVANDTPAPVKALTITSKHIRHIAGTTSRQNQLQARKPKLVMEMEKKLAVAATPSTTPYDARAIQLACRPALLDFYVKSKMAKKAARSKMSLKDRAYACAANAINEVAKDPSRSTVYLAMLDEVSIHESMAALDHPTRNSSPSSSHGWCQPMSSAPVSPAATAWAPVVIHRGPMAAPPT